MAFLLKCPLVAIVLLSNMLATLMYKYFVNIGGFDVVCRHCKR